MSILARRQLRLAVVSVLGAVTGILVESPGDWNVAPSKLPSIKVRAPTDRKISLARTMPEFTTTVTIQIQAMVQATTDHDAQDAIDLLGSQIEDAFFGAQQIVKLCQQFSNVATDIDVNADGEQHVGRMLMSVDCELVETYDVLEINPALYPKLAGIDIHLDTASPFDSTGSYTGSLYPASVTAAPRTTGPDGRDEATLQIDLPQ